MTDTTENKPMPGILSVAIQVLLVVLGKVKGTAVYVVLGVCLLGAVAYCLVMWQPVRASVIADHEGRIKAVEIRQQDITIMRQQLTTIEGAIKDVKTSIERLDDRLWDSRSVLRAHR